jgi:hypothetical protein
VLLDSYRIVLRCKHTISFEGIVHLCDTAVRNMKYEFILKCPAQNTQVRKTITRRGSSSGLCGRRIPLEVVKYHLKPNEVQKLEERINLQTIHKSSEKFKECPFCKRFLFREGNEDVFSCDCESPQILRCWKCIQPIPAGEVCLNPLCIGSVDEVLRNARKKKISCEIKKMPIFRACPSCAKLVYHKDNGCKHVTCPAEGCGVAFCFVCLSTSPENTTEAWMKICGEAYAMCPNGMHPAQKVSQ